MRELRFAFAAIVAMTAVLVPQTRAEAFEVASVRPSKSEGGKSSVKVTPGQITMENVSLRKCIGLAYDVGEDKEYAFSGPGWLNTEAFDIVAKFPPAASREQIALMLQTLLADRFKLKLHHETKELPVYALIVGKNGPRLQKSVSGGQGEFSLAPGRISGKAASMSAFADRLSARVRLSRPVLDLTGLKDTYDFALEWAPDSVQTDDASGPSVFTAIQEQLGLKLDARKHPVEILVIDHAEKVPSEN
jgi:uncharacterized protein (TIGR03435 family)